MQASGPFLREQDVKLLKVLQEATQWQKGGEAVVRCGAETGRIFFTQGRIAWAAASTIKITFTKYLADHTDLSEGEIKEAFKDCKRTGKNFGETILEQGLMEESVLRNLLLQHISQMILEMFSWSGVDALFMPEERAYKGNLTFDLKEVLRTVLALDGGKRLPFGDMSADQVLDSFLGNQNEWAYNDTESSLPQTTLVRRGKKKKSRLLLLLVLLLVGVSLVVFYRDRLWSKKNDASSKPISGVMPKPDWSAKTKPTVEPTAEPSPEPATIDSQNTDLVKTQELASILIRSSPSRAPVYLNGVYTDRLTPCKLADIPAGVEHVVLIEKRGRSPAYRSFRLKNGESSSLKLVLKRRVRKWKSDVTVKVESDPEGAAIFLDGKYTKKTTPARLSLRASSASKLELRRKGYQKWIRTVRPVPRKKLTFSARLEKKM